MENLSLQKYLCTCGCSQKLRLHGPVSDSTGVISVKMVAKRFLLLLHQKPPRDCFGCQQTAAVLIMCLIDADVSAKAKPV